MCHVESLLERIRERPGMYIGKPCVRRLAFFVLGYAHGAEEIGGAEYDTFLPAFREWVQAKFGSTKQGWDDLILAHSPDENTAFDRFWQLFDEFIAERASRNGETVSAAPIDSGSRSTAT